MLNKRIKSLLVAGILVISMTGGVFAEKQTVQGKSTITNPAFVDGVFNKTLQGEGIIIEGSEQEGYYYYLTTSWDSSKLTVKDVILHFEGGGVVYNEALFREDQCGVVQGKEGWKYVNFVNDIDEKVVKIEVIYEAVKGDDPIVPPVDPEDPPVVPPVNPEEPEEDVDDPETGDASIMPIVATALASAAGLFVLSKKDDEE